MLTVKLDMSNNTKYLPMEANNRRNTCRKSTLTISGVAQEELGANGGTFIDNGRPLEALSLKEMEEYEWLSSERTLLRTP